MTLHFKIQRRIQPLVKHAIFQKTPYQIFDWVQDTPLKNFFFKILSFLSFLFRAVVEIILIFFSIWVFFHEHSRFTGQ